MSQIGQQYKIKVPVIYNQNITFSDMGIQWTSGLIIHIAPNIFAYVIIPYKFYKGNPLEVFEDETRHHDQQIENFFHFDKRNMNMAHLAMKRKISSHNQRVKCEDSRVKRYLGLQKKRFKLQSIVKCRNRWQISMGNRSPPLRKA